MNRDEMLRALQADVNAWPQQVKEAGVKNRAGQAFVPQPRNNGILRTPDDPEATYAYMRHVWEQANAEDGSEGWDRIIAQVGPELTWEWFMVDEARPYATLFSDLRERVRIAMDASAGSAAWRSQQRDNEEAEQAQAKRIARYREQFRTGQRKRLDLPELDRRR